MRFRTLALSFMTAVGLVALTSSVYVWTTNLRRLDQVQEGRALVNLIRPTVKFVEAIANERGMTNRAVLSKAHAPLITRRLIADDRAATDSLFALAEKRAGELPADERAATIRLFFRAKTVVLMARREVDPDLADGAPPSREDFVRVVQRYVEADAEIDATLANLERRLARLDPMLASRVEVARLSDDIRVEEGLRAATLARFVSSEKPFTGEERIEAAEDADAVNVTWQRLQQLAEEIGSPAISAGVERVKSEVFDQGEPVYKAVTHAAGVGSPSPMDALTWRQWTNANLPKSLAPRETAIGEIGAAGSNARRSDVRFDHGRFGNRGAVRDHDFGRFPFPNRVVSPIGALTKALDSFAEVGRGSGPTADRSENLAQRFAERRDEIGSLARAAPHMRRHADELGESMPGLTRSLRNCRKG